MEKIIICENENITENLKKLQEMGYTYIVKAQDKFLSGWGSAMNRKHIQLIACKTSEERRTITDDLEKDNSMGYINWYRIDDKQGIYNTIRNKSYTIRNDWARSF